MARLLAEMLRSMGLLKKGHLVEVGRQDVISEYMGQTAIKTTEVDTEGTWRGFVY